MSNQKDGDGTYPYTIDDGTSRRNSPGQNAGDRRVHPQAFLKNSVQIWETLDGFEIDVFETSMCITDF